MAHPVDRTQSTKPSANKRAKTDEPSADEPALPADGEATVDSSTEKSTEDGVDAGLEDSVQEAKEDGDEEEPWFLLLRLRR
ncbi:unnamed protein product [Dibothriocephalus latus]|uniref:Uncharacterized protein n=1 Tax=Dibothriocephalus latus TaxID=60516 RepID=A0A3P7MNT6_DIBLA|nr:unnamed protein product [Dibothriocephalus latus]